MDSRKNRSSSTTETNDDFGIGPPAFCSQSRCGRQSPYPGANQLPLESAPRAMRMPHKFWLRRGLGFLNRAEMPPTQRTYAWFYPAKCYMGAVLVHILVLGYKSRNRRQGSCPGSFCPEQKQCLTQSLLFWSSTTIRILEPRLGVSCDRLA